MSNVAAPISFEKPSVSPLGKNAVTNLQGVDKVMNAITNRARGVQRVINAAFSAVAITNVRIELVRTQNIFVGMENSISKVRKEQDNLNESIEQGSGGAAKLKTALANAAQGLGIEGGIKGIAMEADNKQAALNSYRAQTGVQSPGMAPVEQSMDNLYKNNMGTGYEDLANSLATVTQITGMTGKGLEEATNNALLMRDTFQFDVSDSITAADTLQKQFGIDSTAAYNLIAQGAQNGVNSNGDMLSMITQHAGEFKSLGMNADQMFNAMVKGSQDGTFSMDQLSEASKLYGTEGKNATLMSSEAFKMLGLSADDVNGKIVSSREAMEQLGQLNGNSLTAAMGSLGRVIKDSITGAVTGAVNAAKFCIIDFTAGLSGNLEGVQSFIGEIGYGIFQIGTFFSDNWHVIEPILGGLLIALGLYNGALLVMGVVETISKGLQIASAIATLIHAGALTAQSKATASATLQQAGLNAAILGSPITWIIIAIIALIAIFYALVAAINKSANTTTSATGIIFGGFMYLLSALGNIFISIINLVVDAIGIIWNVFATIAEFVANVFNDPLGSVIRLFANMADIVLSILETLATPLDTILGTNMADSVGGWRESLKGFVDEKIQAPEVKIPRFNPGDYSLDLIDQNAAYDWGYNKGKDLEDKVKGFDPTSILKNANATGAELDKGKPGSSNPPPTPYENTANQDIAKNTANTAANTASIAESTTATSEDLKYLRDISTQKAINRFTTAKISINMKNDMKVNSDRDLDGVVDHLAGKLEETMYAAANGAHY